MDIYHIWCDLKAGVDDIEFVDATDQYLGSLQQQGTLEAYRISRRKLGLGPTDLGEFHIQLEFNGLGQLDEAFNRVASREDPVESFHHAVNSKVEHLRFALYRDFPDASRIRGEEKF